MQIDYVASSGLKPNDPALGLGFLLNGTGEMEFSGGALKTTSGPVEGGSKIKPRFYRRIFEREEFNEETSLRFEAKVTVKVLSSIGSPAATCVQLTTRDGRTFGLGFLSGEKSPDDDQVVLYAASGELSPPFGTYREQDWLWQPEILGTHSLPINVTRTYILELIHQGKDLGGDLVRLRIEGLAQEPLTAFLADLKKQPAVPGLLFGHPVKEGSGSAEWQRLTITTSGRQRRPDLPRQVGNKRQLFLDDWLIDRCENLERELGTPQKYAGNPVMKRDKPWDSARCDLYGSAVWDKEGKKLQLFYQAMSAPKVYDNRLAYAESHDGGQTWVKPNLGLFPFGEEKETNLVWLPRNQFVAGPCVFRDEHEPDSSRRYKLFTCDYGERGAGPAPGFYVGFSPDGIHWQKSPCNPVSPYISDTGQSVFWDEKIGKYVAFVRTRAFEHVRSVGRMESDDFEHWTLPELCFVPPCFQFYSLPVTPYQGIYVGLPWIFWESEASNDWEKHTPVIAAGLAVSRDGWTWQQLTIGKDFLPLEIEAFNASSDVWQKSAVGKNFIPNGPIGSIDERQVRMSSSMVVLDDRILLIYAASRDPHQPKMGVDVCLATLRLDGFVAMAAGTETGRLVTKPFIFEGDNFYVNAYCNKNGIITVALLDGEGKVMPGFGHEQCVPIREDGIKLLLKWRGEKLNGWRGKPVRLEFAMKQSKLYSFWCAE